MVAFCQISVQCPCQGEHTNCFFSTPRILLALWLLLFFPKYKERVESCLGSYLCLWQKNENSCCLGTSHSSILGVHIWIKEKCFVEEKNCYEWVETCYQCCTTPVKAELAPTDWLTEPWGGLGVDNARETTLLCGSCDEARHFCLEGDNLSAPVFTDTAIWHRQAAQSAWLCGLQNMLELSVLIQKKDFFPCCWKEFALFYETWVLNANWSLAIKPMLKWNFWG